MGRRRQIGMNRFWVLVSAVIAVPLLIGLLLMIFINPNDYRQRIEAAVGAAVGRQLKINGDIEVGFGFAPTITIHQIRLANPPGFSRDSMAAIGSIQADVSLLPLLIGKLNIGKLNVYDADVQIEVNPLGQSNTDFSKPHADKSGASQDAGASGGGNPADKLSVHEIGIFGGRFATRDDQHGVSHVLVINRAVVHSSSKSAPVSAVVDVEYDGTPLAFTAETGPVARLLGQGDLESNWPVKLEGTSTGSKFTLVGSLRDPIAGRGYAVDVTADIADLASFNRIAGGKLPPVHGLRTSFHVADDGGVPDISAVVVRSERSDLSSYVDGLQIDRLVLTGSAMNQPIHAEVFGSFSQQPLDAVVDVGAPRALIRALLAMTPATGDAGQPMPISLSSHVAGAEFNIKGQIANPAQLSGLSGAVDIQIPDLSALSALVGQKLPALKNLSFTTDIADMRQNDALGVSLHRLAFDSSVGDLNGNLDIGLSPQIGVHGTITGKLLDLDALQIAAARAASANVVSAATAPRARQSANRRVFTDTPIDFSPLTKADIDLKLKVGELRSGGLAYRDLDGHLVLSGGKLTVDPLSAVLPGGKFTFKLGVDSQALPPEVSLAVNAPGVPLKPLLQAAGQPDDVTGNVDIGVDFVAAGRTPRALASSFTGRIGVAMVDGELDNRMLGATLSDVMRVAHVPAEALVGGSGANRTKLRCAALRVDAVRGLAQVNALALQTAVAQLVGSGTFNLAEETIGLRLKPGLRTPGVSVVVPVRVTGVFMSPQASIDTGVSAAAVANSVSGGISGLARNPLGALSGAANAVVANDDPCAPALESARGALSASK